MKAYRITMTVDHGWLNAITEMTSYVQEGEICSWESVSDPFDVDPKRYWMTKDEYLALLE